MIAGRIFLAQISAKLLKPEAQCLWKLKSFAKLCHKFRIQPRRICASRNPDCANQILTVQSKSLWSKGAKRSLCILVQKWMNYNNSKWEKHVGACRKFWVFNGWISFLKLWAKHQKALCVFFHLLESLFIFSKGKFCKQKHQHKLGFIFVGKNLCCMHPCSFVLFKRKSWLSLIAASSFALAQHLSAHVKVVLSTYMRIGLTCDYNASIFWATLDGEI